MRYLVLSDIHSNLQALEAVLADAARAGCDDVLVLGDLVGYGADPAPVIARVRALDAIMIRGNHDKACAGLADVSDFTADARVAIEWTSGRLSRDELTFLAALPQGPRRVGEVIICHGAPFDEDFYIFGAADARRAVASVRERLCLFGHTHVPAAWGTKGLEIAEPESVLRFPEGSQLLVNVGSVGQPRDGDPRAAYGVLDTALETITFCRVAYDIAGAQKRIRDEGLPARLADRLAVGC